MLTRSFCCTHAEAAEASKSTTPSKSDPPVEVENKKRPAALEMVEGEEAPQNKAQCVDAC